MGGTFDKSDFEDEYFWSETFYPRDLITKRIVKKNEVVFGDSIIWRRQKENLETFLSDFSAGVKLNIIPFETNDTEFEIRKPQGFPHYIYIGLVKSEYLNKSNKINKGQYNLQLNDRIANIDDLRSFIFCYHCDYDKLEFFIHADQNVPKSYLDSIIAELSKFRISLEDQVYYLYINKKNRKFGYKKTTPLLK